MEQKRLLNFKHNSFVLSNTYVRRKGHKFCFTSTFSNHIMDIKNSHILNDVLDAV